MSDTVTCTSQNLLIALEHPERYTSAGTCKPEVAIADLTHEHTNFTTAHLVLFHANVFGA